MGRCLNAAAFIGGNYLARAFGGGDKAVLEEKQRHDKALEGMLLKRGMGNGEWGMGNGEWDDSGEWEIKMGI